MSGNPPRKRAKLKRKSTFLNVGRYQRRRGDSPWRRPRGIDNKQRISLKGRAKIVSVGYGSKRGLRGLHPSGLIPKVVHSPGELEQVPEGERDGFIIYVGHDVGKRKKIALLDVARKLGFKVANE